MARAREDLTGQKFGKLTVIGADDRGIRKPYFYCMCECGRLKSVRSDSLKSGKIRSCGCLKKEQDKVNLIMNHKHKMSHTRIYSIWQNMKGRCNNIHDPRYDRYGGRGIKVCEEWEKDFTKFYAWALENGYSEDLTIDRIDNDGDYTPENCRWADQKEQARNRDTNIKITIGRSTRTLTEWCEIFGLDFKTVVARYNRNGFGGIDELFNR